MTATTEDRPPHGRSVRELIADLAHTEDDLREVRPEGSLAQRSIVVRRQARIVRELRRRSHAPR